MKMNFIDLRKELRLIRDNVGFSWVALRSVDLSIPCIECQAKVAANYDQAPGFCKTCLGIGYTFIDKLVLGFKYRPVSLFQVRGQNNVGPIGVQTVSYVLQYNANPKPVDWILDLQLNETTQTPVQPFVIKSAYRIEDVTIMRSDFGRIEFFKCGVLEQNLTIGRFQ